MANIIAIVWDFDKTLIDGYMEDPIFEEYGVDARQFWDEVNALPQKYMDEQKVRVNADTIYLNHMINYVQSGKFKGLSNEKLRKFGEKMRQEQRINMFAEADCSKGSTASMWLCNKVEEFAERIREEEKSRLRKYTASGEVRHLL